jgi:hypothetical protein
MYSISSLPIVDCVHASAYDVSVKSELLNACFKENLLVIKTQFLAASILNQSFMILNRCTLVDWLFVLFLFYCIDYLIGSGAENDKMTVSLCLFQIGSTCVVAISLSVLQL